ncbi:MULTISPECIES: type II secretion system protein [Synergistaceae]|uniref:type II secretion system protein n=1 Tax=Synergistaceae TaxID=649777 RepID=UPI003ADEE599|nr:type II secretion system GspH family protein [Synergistaceae bacterium DZ-S4]
MNVKRKRAFTLVEVMVAVVILSLTATAAIRLVMLGQEGLRGAKAEITLTQEAKAIRTGIMLGTVQTSGKRGDIIWETSDGTKEMFGENFGRLDFSGREQTNMIVINEDMRWKEIRVSNTKDERHIVIYMPYD